MLTVQPSAGLYFATQYDGTNGQAIVTRLGALDYSNFAGTAYFKAAIMRAGGLLTSGHQFSVPLGHWVIWAEEEGRAYVVAPPLTDAAFQQQYQQAVTPGDISALQADAAALQVSVGDLETDILAINASQITAGTLAYQRLGGTVAEADTVVFNRATLVDPNTAADTWQWRYNDTRTVYGNEYNCLRVRGIPDDQVPARFMSNFARDGLSTAIFQVSLSNATSHLFQVLGSGDILGPGAASMLPTAPVGVAYVAAGAANATAINDGNVAQTGAPYPVTTTLQAANNRVYIDGGATNTSGVAIAAQTTLFTVAAAHRPTAWVQFTARTSNNLACRVTVKGATGAACLDQQLAAGATINFDGGNWRKA